jgi:hypothetical protein
MRGKVVVALLAAFAVAAQSDAQNSAWTNAAGGLWANAANWSAGVPGQGGVVDAYLTSNTVGVTYTVTNDPSIAVNRLYPILR